MRLEQLVIYGPGDDERVRFGPAVTVFAGLDARARADLVATIVDSLTGRVQNASVIYGDHAGQKVFADRTGATYAATGQPAPGPGELLGKDPSVAAKLLTITAEGLGLGRQASLDELQDNLAGAKAELDRLAAAHNAATAQAERVANWREEMVELDHLIDQSDADRARWAWVEKRRRLDEVRTELAMRTEADHGASDRQILDAVDALRSTGAVWAEVSAETAQFRDELGPIPAVSADDLARVAATPSEIPDGCQDRIDAWKVARDVRHQAEAALLAAVTAPDEPDDLLVIKFAALDQTQLWEVHHELDRSTASYDAIVASLGQGSIDPEAEAAIELAHVGVVRRQREIHRRFVPGMLGSALLAVGGLLAGHALSILVGVFMLVASVAMGLWVIVAPRRRLAQANAVELEALSHTEANSWLGVHLRRLDATTDVADRRRVEVAANARASAQVDWDETTSGLQPEDFLPRADSIHSYAAAIDPKAVALRREQAQAASTAATAREVEARQFVGSGLERYGLTDGGAADLDPQQLATLLTRRVEAGHLARRAKKLAGLEERETDAAKRLDDLLNHLGFAEGDLQVRLERAIAAVGWARQRQELASEHRTDADIETEIAELAEVLRMSERKDWADVPEPSEAPPDPELLEAKRQELAARVTSAGRPDVVGAERSEDLARATVNDLETRLAELESGPGSLQQRLISRLGRATWLGDHEESIPVIMDDPLLSVPVAERMDLLDLLVRLSKHTQVIMLTADPVVSRWARDRSLNEPVVLFETEAEIDAPIGVY